MNDFSERLKALRENKNLTQGQLAELLNTNDNKVLPQNISYWEKGRQPSFDILISLSKIFDVSIDYLVGATPYKSKQEEKELTNVVSSESDIDQRIVNTLINMKEILTFLKNSNINYFEDYIRFLSISKEYFLEMGDLFLDTQLEILELKDMSLESIRGLLRNNDYKFKKLEDIYFMLTKFLNSVSMDYKSDLVDSAFSKLIDSMKDFNNQGK